jgi:prophage maintenance system killer protein
MNDLTVEQIISVHKGIMEKDGGDTRMLSEAGLHQMVFLANLIDEVYHRASFALYTLCAYPAFREGNKRTALLTASHILGQEGYHLPPDDIRLAGLLRGIISFTVELEEIEQWLRKNVKKDKE